MDKIPFEAGRKIKNAYVVIDGVEHEVVPAQYSEEDGIPLSPYVLNLLQNNVENAINDLENSVVTIKEYLDNNTDLNNVTESGIYYTGGRTLINAPVTNYDWAFVIVIKQLSITHQYFIKPVAGIICVREYSGSPAAWCEWKNIVKDNSQVIEQYFSMGIFSGNADKFGQTATISIPSGYTAKGIVGYALRGGYYSHIFLSELELNGSTIGWSAKNTAPNQSKEITCRVKILIEKQ